MKSQESALLKALASPGMLFLIFKQMQFVASAEPGLESFSLSRQGSPGIPTAPHGALGLTTLDSDL